MSNTIYDGTKYHYVYQITEISTGMKYIGVRSCKCEPINDIGIKYFSSSTNNEFIKNQKTNPDDYMYEVLSTYESRVDANTEEVRLHELYEVSKNKNFYNKSISKSKYFGTDGLAIVKNEFGESITVPMDDERYINGLYHGQTKGLTYAQDKEGNKYHVSIDDARLKDGTLFGNRKGRTTAYDEYGVKHDISTDDIRLKSGELKIKGTNKFVAENINGDRIYIDSNDERYTSGEYQHATKGLVRVYAVESNELIHITKDEYKNNKSKYKHVRTDKVTVKDKHGNTCTVGKDDPRYLSGELTSNMCGMSNYKDIHGNPHHLATNDPRVLSGEMVSVQTGMIRAIGKNIKSHVNVYKDDPRLESGELLPQNKKYYEDFLNDDGLVESRSIFIKNKN